MFVILVRVISFSLRLRSITPSSILIILDIIKKKKPSSSVVYDRLIWEHLKRQKFLIMHPHEIIQATCCCRESKSLYDFPDVDRTE